jgi:hypothetical protein
MLKKKFLLSGKGLNDLNDKLSISLNKQLQVLISIVIIGYFGVKIVYGFFFKFYPDKYYFRDIDITTTINDEEDNEYNYNKKKIIKNIALNAYVPGIWNNEMTDFITTIILTFIIFIYTNLTTKSIIMTNGNINLSFLFGYIIGLGYPPVNYNYNTFLSEEFRASCIVQYLYLIILISFIIFVIILNYYSVNPLNQESHMNYIIYVVAIILIFFGLIFSKKNIESYSSINYFYRNEQKCLKKDTEPGIVQTSGDKIKLTAPFLAFIVLLLFSFEPESLSLKYLYLFIYGFLIGILVSSISYYGIEFFLVKNPIKECVGEDECRRDLMPVIPIIDEESNNLNWETNQNSVTQNITQKLDGSKFNYISNIKIFFIIFIMLVFIYLIYHFIIKSN